jgi:transketolase
MSRRDDGAQLEADWQARFDRWRESFAEAAEDWDRAYAGELLDGWEGSLPTFDPEQKAKLATRAAGASAMEAFKPFAPTMAGGAADLVESTKTAFEGAGTFSACFAGRNIPFGVREHAMGAIVNGLALHGGLVKPFGSTFLIFSDYMRPSVRLSALMGLPVVWAWTHDSVGLGEDGPTHQPIEHLAALRAIPNLWVVRPADANETSYAWKVALERRDGPVALVLTRQDVPVLRRGEGECVDAAGAERGAYVLWEANGDGDPDLVLLATGSEVSVALEAARTLAADGVAARVVSMPCWELFADQPTSYRDEVLPPDCGARLAVEAATSFGWERWTGTRGDVVSIERFGASAPGATVLEELGFTPENVAARARVLLERTQHV